MHSPSRRFLIAGFALLSAGQAQTWTNNAGAGDSLFDTPSNWSPSGVPSSGASLTIARNDDLIFNLGAPFSANSIAVNSSIAAVISNDGFGNALTIGTGGVTLNATSSLTFNIPVNLNSAQTWNIGNNTLVFGDNIDLLSNASVTINLSNGAQVSFLSASSPTWAGTINFTVVGSTSILAANLNSNNFSKITINGAAVQLIGNQLQAIPEPSTIVALAGLGALTYVSCRRRRQIRA